MTNERTQADGRRIEPGRELVIYNNTFPSERRRARKGAFRRRDPI